MNPAEVGRSYDAIAERWRDPGTSLTGVEMVGRAVRFVRARGVALDVGCGCSGRFFRSLRREGFIGEGVNVSGRMIELARERDPGVTFYRADVCEWVVPRRYDLTVGWDGIWHVPLGRQEGVLRKLCGALEVGGVVVFSMGGTDGPGEVRDEHMGVPMYTATLGVPKVLEVLGEGGCVCRHLEYDQFPELHVAVIGQRV